MDHDLPLITTIAAAFTAAWVLGIVTQRLRLSPIVGYLLAGIAIGPHTPGFVGDLKLAQQLAELGVILLMFGVGLHFHPGDLLAVRKVAVPGAIGQSLVATLLGVAVAVAFGMSARSGIVLGMAMAVASTVVLIRVLTDNRMLDTPHGHVAVGWLIVEDILTVVVLVLIPALGTAPAVEGHAPAPQGVTGVLLSLGIALLKLGAMVAILLLAGSRVIPWVMVRVARLRSRELFTLTVLVMAIAVAAGSYKVFGASMALGAFLAGMVVGQSPVSQQAAADALPLRDAFAVLFFTSVGMLFDPAFPFREPGLMLAGLGIVMVGKPLAALAIVAVIGYPARTALVVALALAQIGEFSFILSDLGRAYQLIGPDAHNLLVACAIVSITVNPLLFRLVGPAERGLQRWPALWRFLNRRAAARGGQVNEQAGRVLERSAEPLAVIVGYGPVGQAVDSILRTSGLETVVVDLNMDTVRALTKDGRPAIYGDAFNIEVMHQALPRATHLVITLPHSTNRNPLIAAAKLVNPDMKIFVRARYLAERAELEQVGADVVAYEEAEASVALARLVLFDRGADPDTVRRETTRIRQQLGAEVGSR
ncbi:MAG: Inner membrane protein YbaL, KefB/KefC family [uncultured Phycisphaerae bacterium]|uniref:Inner membrane protein YbaL, KefB/KefC family n=1 Tax=uncultured Phycisphaerae bacterium TaxID=904963 RepID=A0A6J4PCD1_9BACT|nr:MAG: Inner membrane protein YbaL, KefB/KefC family [uncultured Phycisphaerae bacterium]